MHNGIYLTKLAILGSGKPPAEVTFSKGLNAITGASNTGKSYIFNCMDFVFGAQDPPKPITESEGYDKVRAEIRTYDGKVFTLSRQFNDTFAYLSETSFEDFKDNAAKKFSVKLSENETNLSGYLLKLLGLVGKKLKNTKYNETKTLSFRLLSKFCLVSEEKIIKSTSPISTDQFTEETLNKSLFKLLLTGKDDDDLEEIENPKTYKSKITGKIELTQSTIEEKQRIHAEIKRRVDSLNSDELNLKIDELVTIVNTIQKDVFVEEQKRQNVWNEISHLKGNLNQTEELINRFKLLDEHYTSDLHRLDFVNEGKQYLDQIEKVNCPICDSLIEQKVLEPYEDGDNSIVDSMKSEFQKIKNKQQELTGTITKLEEESRRIKTELKSKELEFNEINTHISGKLKPFHEANYQNLQNFLHMRDEKSQLNLVAQEITKLNSDLLYYREKYKEKKDAAVESVLPEKVYSDLSNEIKAILTSWGVEHNTVRYDPSANDIIIDGEERRNFGKGYRAIYLSAFMIGVMFYCLKNKLKHPYFLVLDSPLTSYKERDHTDESIDPKNQLPEDLPNKFYQSLSELKGIQDVQIIVIDNKAPPSEINNITTEHFSKNFTSSRYGFYPVAAPNEAAVPS